MNKLLTVVVASALALGSVSGFAADTTKTKEELTQAERAEMRSRAETLRSERGLSPQARASVAHSGKAKQELTQEERTEMRNRAERLMAERGRR